MDATAVISALASAARQPHGCFNARRDISRLCLDETDLGH
jgi:hypothetical protein